MQVVGEPFASVHLNRSTSCLDVKFLPGKGADGIIRIGRMHEAQ